MKRLLVFLKDYKLESVLGPLFKLLEASFELVVPLVMARIIDVGIAEGDAPAIGRMCLVLVALAAIGLACSITAQYFAARAATGFATGLRHALFAHIEGFSYEDVDRAGASTLITRMTSDVNQVQSGVNLTLRLFSRSPFIVLGAMAMAFTIDVRSALVFVVAIPLLSVVVFGIMLSSIPLYRRVQSALDAVLAATRENLSGSRVIRAFRREGREIEDFHEKNDRLADMQIFVGRISALLNPVTSVIVNGAIAVLVWTGALRVDAGAITQGEVVALVNYMSQILVELVKFADLLININKSLACAKRIEAVFDMGGGAAETGLAGQDGGTAVAAETGLAGQDGSAEITAETGLAGQDDGTTVEAETGLPAGQDDGAAVAAETGLSAGHDGGIEIAAETGLAGHDSGTAGHHAVAGHRAVQAPPMVEFEGVGLAYAGAGDEALSDISFSVKRGETIGIIGGTGAGKTSLVNLIPRFYEPTRGIVRVAGRDAGEIPIRELRDRIGVVPQKALLFQGTVRDNLRWGKGDATDGEMYEALEIAQAREFVDEREGGLSAAVGQGGRNFSGGQRQRLAIARAIIRKPEILILDDSFSALDYATDARLRGAIAGMGGGTTIFIVSQRAASILRADRIIVLDDGRMAGFGTHGQLMASCPVYREIYESQYGNRGERGKGA